MNKIYILGKYQTKTKGVKNASPGVIKCCFFNTKIIVNMIKCHYANTCTKSANSCQ